MRRRKEVCKEQQILFYICCLEVTASPASTPIVFCGIGFTFRNNLGGEAVTTSHLLIPAGITQHNDAPDDEKCVSLPQRKAYYDAIHKPNYYHNHDSRYYKTCNYKLRPL